MALVLRQRWYVVGWLVLLNRFLACVLLPMYADMSTKHNLEYFVLAHICPLCGYSARGMVMAIYTI